MSRLAGWTASLYRGAGVSSTKGVILGIFKLTFPVRSASSVEAERIACVARRRCHSVCARRVAMPEKKRYFAKLCPQHIGCERDSFIQAEIAGMKYKNLRAPRLIDRKTGYHYCRFFFSSRGSESPFLANIGDTRIMTHSANNAIRVRLPVEHGFKACYCQDFKDMHAEGTYIVRQMR